MMDLFLVDSLCHANGSRGADQAAEVAADALGADEARLSGVAVEDDGLVAAIHAGGVAAPAAHALVAVDLRIDNGFAVEVGGCDEVRHFLSYEVGQAGDAALLHIVLHAEREVVDDAVAVLHHGGAYLYVATAKLDELQGVAPGLNASDAAQLHFLSV